jgi:hypothetical protein
MLQQRGLTLRAAAPDSSPTTKPSTATANATNPTAPWPPTGWRGQLWADLQQLLQAELALRWQAIQGLLDALQDEAEAALTRHAAVNAATHAAPHTALAPATDAKR